MAGIFNFPYLQLNEILKVSEQTYTINMNYNFQQNAANILLYVKSGQLLLYAQTSYIINSAELLIVPTTEQVTLVAAVPDTVVVYIIFKATSPHLPAIQAHIFKSINATLLTKIMQQNDQITFLRRRKPEMSYDVEIGEFFTASCALLYTEVTQLLLLLSEMEIKTRLPNTVTATSTLATTLPDPKINKNQLIYAKSASGTLYKNLLVKQIITYMKANLDKHLSITIIAQEFLVGSSNLKKIFKKETGSSIMTYFKELRMTAATNLIEQHKLTVTEIATQLGFSSSHHFSSAFKQYTGVSPTQYYANLAPTN